MKSLLRKIRAKWHSDLYTLLDNISSVHVPVINAECKLYDAFITEQTQRRRKDRMSLPVTRLKKRHFKNLKYVLDRYEMLSLFPKKSICAEIGVASGNYSQDILRIVQPQKLHLIDMWGSERYGEDKMHIVKTIFSNQIRDNQIVLNRGLSTEVLQTFDNAYFDWVYIDSDHSYETTKQELELCMEKVKPEGIIAGHDYCIGNWDTGLKYGVIEAVYEFCLKHDWELVFITSDISHASFSLKKL